MSAKITESTVEDAALEWFKGLGYSVLHGPDIAPGETSAEREGYGDVVLEARLRRALEKINPAVPAEVVEDAFRKLLRTVHESPAVSMNNQRFHTMLADGVEVEYKNPEGRIAGDRVMLADFDNPDNNDWLVVNQFTVIEGQSTRRPDVVVFLNGLPVGVLELKNPGDEQATVKKAFQQIQTYKHEIPSLFAYNEVIVVSDGLAAKAGTLTSDWEWFLPWRTVEGKDVAETGLPELEVLIRGVFEKKRLLDLLRHFIVFETGESTAVKKMAAYHQFHAVNRAVECTLAATSPGGDRRVGVVWHTQGSGKSLTMTFYAGKIVRHPRMENPTLVVITDRNDLDDQLYGTFSNCRNLLRQKPVQSEGRAHLKELLKVASGGVVFTTIQKFFPEQKGGQYPLLSDRRNIVVIADEAHRSQYDFIDGFARHMRDALPNASFIGFTGTPLELSDRSTPAVFGNYISIYDIQRAIEDGATVPIYYEARLAKLELREEERPKIDPEFEELTEGEEETVKEKLKRRWARIEAMVGTEKRIRLIAKDIVEHFEQRLEVMDGKGMIVCMSRRICVDLYDAIIKLRPGWHSEDNEKGFLKVVMTGSASDPVGWQKHIRNRARREAVAGMFKDPGHPFKLVIVRDMWLTGFDVPCLHTMYIDKPMRGHGLMQTIARVNRVFGDKPGGLVVDYLGIADELRKALSNYTERDRDLTGIDQEEAVAVMVEKYEIITAMFHGFDFSRFFAESSTGKVAVIKEAMEHILSLEDGKRRYMQAVTELSKAFALSVPHEKALAIKDEVGFFQTVRASLTKNTLTIDDGKEPEDLEAAVRQIVSKAVLPGGVVDVFSAAGLKKPDISILSDEFLEEVRNMPQKNLALEALRKLLNDEIKTITRRNLVQARSFSEMLTETIRKYQNRTIEAAQVIAELIELAKEMREAHRRGEKLNLTDEELAFYDALESNESAVEVLGDDTLKVIARELVETVRKNVTIDWTVKESVKARLRTVVRRILRKYGYPPDKQEVATRTVLEQAELLCADWAA